MQTLRHDCDGASPCVSYTSVPLHATCCMAFCLIYWCVIEHEHRHIPVALGLSMRGKNLVFSYYYKCANIYRCEYISMRRYCIGHMVAAVPCCHAKSHACTCFCSAPTIWYECAPAVADSPILRCMPVWGLGLLLTIGLLEVALAWPLRGIPGHRALHSSKVVKQAL